MPCSEWTQDSITNVFGNNLDVGGDCFLAINHTHGYVFQNNNIRSRETTWKQFHDVPDNPFHMPSLNDEPDACVETCDPNFTLFLEDENMWLYNAEGRFVGHIGLICG